MKKTSLLTLLTVVAAGYLFLTSSSSGRASAANDDYTGAPGSNGTCGNCHSGGAFGSVTASIQIFQAGTTTPVTSYTAGTSYDMRVTFSNFAGSPAGFGFQLVCLTAVGNNPVSNAYTNLGTNVKQKLVTVGAFNGKRYVEHNGVTANNIFNFTWTAPTAGTGAVKFYASGNAVNGFGSTSGDVSAAGVSITVNEATALSASGTVTNVSCFGGNNGAINLTPAGGTSPYTYNWGGGIVSEDRSNLTAGTYTVTVTDNVSATTTASFTVTQPSAALSGTGTTVNVSCFGTSNGIINLTAAGGTSPYTYNWGGGITTEDRTNLFAGSYTVTITDSKSCTATASFSITQPSAALSASGTTQNVSCFGGTTGSINLTSSGGTSPYTYNWGGGITTEDRSNLVSGSYAVTVTDNLSCTVSSSFTINQPSTAVSGSGVVQNVSCNAGTNGSINLTPSGGTGSYTFNWGAGITTEDRASLAAGLYTVTITDASTCTGTASFNVTQPAVISLSSSNDTINCFGGTASVFISAQGGTAPFLGTGTFTQGAGLVNYVVQDGNGCTNNINVTLAQPTQLSASANDITIPCAGGSGTVTVSASGGTAPYNGTGNFTVSTPGQQSYLVTDANGCTATATSTVSSSSGLTSTDSVVSLRCNGICQGAIFVNVSGGSPPYVYAWSNNLGAAPSVSSLCAGSYTQTVTDNSNCQIINNYIVNDVAALNITVAQDSILCYGQTAQLSASVTGGTPPYDYLWSNGNGAPSAVFNASTRFITVTDANNCTSTDTVVIPQPDSLQVTITGTTPDNGSGTGAIDLSVGGGTSPYTFDWSNGGTTEDLSQLGSGNYSVTITDANGCLKVVANIAILNTDLVNIAQGATSIYPNPFHDLVYISTITASLLQISDMKGSFVRNITLEPGLNTLELTDFASGFYLFSIRNEQGKGQWKLFKPE